jgi:hypothetical protein
MAFSPDVKLLAIPLSQWEVQLINLATGRQVATLANPDAESVGHFAFSPDGCRLALASSTSPSIQLWDLRALRRQLDAMGLDWDLRGYPPAALPEEPGTGRRVEPLQVQLDLGELKDTPTYKVMIAFQIQDQERLHAKAARLYAEGFAAEPKLAENLNAHYRYNAACAAALAGCGQGDDAAKLDEKERTRLRKQALAWLRADLTACGRILEKHPEQARAAVQQWLRHWQQDADFAGVRGDGLAKLAEAERLAWQQLWADVEKTLMSVEHEPVDTEKKLGN